jgi:hypothetical protein
MHHQVPLLRERSLAIKMWAFEQLETRVHRFQVQIQPVPSSELLDASWEGAGDQRVLEMRSLMILEMLFEFELLAAVLAFEIPQR